MVSVAEANQKVQKTVVNMDRFDRIVNGGIDDVVPVDDGSVRSLRGIQEYGKPGPTGDTGPANNTRLTLALLKSAATTDKTSLYDGSLWTWTLGDFTGLADDVNIVKADSTALSTGAWLRQLDQVYVRRYGADPKGVAGASAAFSRALAAAPRVVGAPGDVYLLDSAVVVPAGREIIGNGAGLKIGAGVIGLRLENDRCKVSGWTLIGNGGLYGVLNFGDGNEFSGNLCTGNIGHYCFSAGSDGTTVKDNVVEGLTADTEISTAFVFEGCSNFTMTNNRVREMMIGWGVQARGGCRDFNITGNTFFQTQYRDSKVATANQKVFNFTLGRACFKTKIQINGRPLSPGPGPLYTVSGSGPDYTVTFTTGRAAGENVAFIGYRGAENIQINGASFGAVCTNNINGGGDAGIILLGSDITCTSNTVRNVGYCGIAEYGDQDRNNVSNNTIENCAQMDDGISSPDFPDFSSPFAGAIFLGGTDTTAVGNTITNSGPMTMRYGITLGKTDIPLRIDGSAAIDLAANTYIGDFRDGKVYAPNQNPGQRVNSVKTDGALVMYEEQINLDQVWGTAEIPYPPSTPYITVGGSGGTRAMRDQVTRRGGLASLRTVPGQEIDFLFSGEMLMGTSVEVTFWAKSNGGVSYLRVFTKLGGIYAPLEAKITDTNWRLYVIRVVLTPDLTSEILVRMSADSESANFQHIKVNGRMLW